MQVSLIEIGSSFDVLLPGVGGFHADGDGVEVLLLVVGKQRLVRRRLVRGSEVALRHLKKSVPRVPRCQGSRWLRVYFLATSASRCDKC